MPGRAVKRCEFGVGQVGRHHKDAAQKDQSDKARSKMPGIYRFQRVIGGGSKVIVSNPGHVKFQSGGSNGFT